MKFFIVSKSNQNRFSIPKDAQYPLIVISEESWNDYSYRTSCLVRLHKSDSENINLGVLKIMRRGQKPGDWVFENVMNSPESLDSDNTLNYFENLDKDFCSLSSDNDFYKRIGEEGKDFVLDFLKRTRNVIFNKRIWDEFSEEPCFQVSLLRAGGDTAKFRDVLAKKINIERKMTRKFFYSSGLSNEQNSYSINFDFTQVNRSSLFPHRINLLVGRNGAGKTQLLANLAIAITRVLEEGNSSEPEDNSTQDSVGSDLDREKIEHSGRLTPVPSFYKVIAISFNAFDRFERPKNIRNKKIYTYCGLLNEDGNLCSEDELKHRIKTLEKAMLQEQRIEFFISIKNMLSLDHTDYDNLSAGQRILLNIIAHLIFNLKENSLVLLDEPENHLHPSLMTTFITEFTRLLNKYNSFAIIATHSPIIAQQIPSRSIRIMSRFNSILSVKHPDIECFGENLSEISDALFEAHEFERDYTTIIDNLIKTKKPISEILEKYFPNGLGANARAYLYTRGDNQ